MIGIFLAATFIISGCLVFNRNKVVNYLLVALYAALLLGLGVYEYQHLNTIQLGFFKADSLGVLLLLVLCIVSVPVLYHSYRYMEFHNPDETPRSRGLYFGAILLLMSACGAAYLSNHIAVTWIFIEITTLSASILIYHHRNIRHLKEPGNMYLSVP